MKKEKYLYKFFKRYYSVFLISLLVFTYLFISSNLELIKTSAIFISFFVFLFFVINNKSNLLHIFFQLGILAFSTFMIYKSLNITILSIVFIFIILKYLISNDLLGSDYFKLLDSINTYTAFSLIFLTVIVFQNLYLDIETIDWDVHSYLVTSLDISRGNLPYENQWEDKQPVLFYLYYLFIYLAKGNLVYFKLLNDVLIFLCAIIVFLISQNQSNNKKQSSLISAFIFVCLMSIPWGTAEYSELYSVLFMGFAFYLLLGMQKSKFLIFISGLLFSVSTLINIGTLLFSIAYLFQIYFLSKKKFIHNMVYFGCGFILLHVFFLILYFLNGLIDIYIATLITIPFGYGSNLSINLNSFNSFLKSFFEYNPILYLLLIASMLLKIFNVGKDYFDNKKIRVEDNILNIYILLSIAFFLLAAKGFNHHLVFFIFFISINAVNMNFEKIIPIFGILIISFFMTQLFTYSKNTDDAFEQNIEKKGYKSVYSNLTNLSSIENDYPLKKLSDEIDSYFEKEYTVLALDSNLILFYLDKPNYSYVIHPTNHFEPWITSSLLKLNRISENNIIDMINEKPDVIICSHTSIAKDSINYKYFNCEVSDYYPEYIKLKTRKYERDIQNEYYFDRYKDISVFLKLNE